MKSNFKLYALLLSFVMVISFCPVFAAENAEEELPEKEISYAEEELEVFFLMPVAPSEEKEEPTPLSVIYEDNFEGEELSANIVKARGEGSLFQAEGSLLMVRDENEKYNVIDETQIWVNADKTPTEAASTGFEFTLSHSKEKQLDLGFFTENGEKLFGIKTASDSGIISLTHKKTAKGKPQVSKTTLTAEPDVPVKFNVVFNRVTGCVSIWINDTTVLFQSYCLTSGTPAYMNMELKARNDQTVALSEFKIYEASLFDEECVQMDAAALNFSDFSREPLDAVTGNLTLPTAGEYGSLITWESDNEAIVSRDGTVNRSNEGDTDVTLTATVSFGEASKKVKFYITVLRKITVGMPDSLGGCLVSDELKGTERTSLYSALSGSPKGGDDGIRLNAGDAFCYLYDKDRTTYGDVMAHELKIAGEGTVLQVVDNKETVCFSVKLSDNAVLVQMREAKGEEAKWQTVKEGLRESEKLTLLTDPMSGVFTLWYGEDKLSAHILGAAEASRLYKINVRQESGQSVVSNLKIYKASVPQEEAVWFDYSYLTTEALTWQRENAINENLTLPKVGNAGSEISWVSDNESVISAEGEVFAPESGKSEATLTATVSLGDESLNKAFNFEVIPKEQDELPEIKTLLFEENFSKNEALANWNFDETDGTIAVREEALQITRTSNDEGDTVATLYFDDMQSYLQGIYGIDFTASKSAEKSMWIYLRGVNHYFSATWGGNGQLSVNYRENEESASSTKKVGTFGDRAHFTILFNTPKSTFSLWVNGKQVLHNAYARTSEHGGLQKALLYFGGDNFMTAKIDNIRFYEAYNLAEDRVALDYEWLTEEKATAQGDPAVQYGYVSCDLDLPAIGSYGSNISWKSSAESVITSEGKLVKTDEFRTVKLTATISAGDVFKEKELTFVVMPKTENDAEAIMRDAEMVTYENLSLHENGSRQIKRSLNLVSAGAYGSTITWETSDNSHITESGRVVRPRFDEENAKVTMTATVKKGNQSLVKEFEFEVLADEEFKDPMFMSDEEFFGVWENGAWQITPKWDYTYSGMEEVGEAAKSGNYSLAKEKLLDYFKNKRKSNTTLSQSSRNTGWANLMSDDFYHMGFSIYYQGSMYVGNEWQAWEANVKTSELSAGNTVSYSVRSWYNEASYLEIARSDAENSAMRPRLELMVNGVRKVFEAECDAEIRAGDYKEVNYKDEEYLHVQNFGDFLQNDTRQGVIKFNLSSLKSSDTVTSAKLILYARAVPSFSGEKRIAIIREPNSGWNRDNATWNSFTGYVYSYNGLPEKNTWEKVENADAEYLWQSCRFYPWDTIALEYQMTGDEAYAYKAMRIMEDFLTDVGGWKSSSTGYTYDENGMRGAFPRTLDAVGRNGKWMDTIDVFIKSDYATADFCTAVLKSVWDTANFLTYYNTATGNWRQYEFNGIMEAALKMPEFIDSRAGRNWYQIAQTELEQLIFLNNLDDGSYVEACNSYAASAFLSYVEYRSNMIASGGDVSDEYKDLLLKMAYYNAALFTSDGTGLQYGDSGASTRSAEAYQEVCRWYNDKELEYIITYGNNGTKPNYTSQHFEDSTVTVMRSGWTKNAPYLFTNVRGGGQHGHTDYNGVIVYAYGKVLLNDAGIFTYTSTDPYRKWGISSAAHNTVLINDTTQTKDANAGFEATGKVYDFSTNASFDYLSQSTFQTAGYEHRRSITFIKPNIWIVSDLMEPDNKTKLNNYKQLWHMLPNSGMSISDTAKTISSNYDSGGNIIVASADGDAVTVKEETGWYDRNYQTIETAPYAYFEKNNCAGDTSLDTVLMVSNDDSTAKLRAQKLDTSNSAATALKIKFTQNESNFVGYYFMCYDNAGGAFGQYETDAQVAYVQENEQGKAVSVLLKNGSYIKTSDGKMLFEAEEQVGEVYVDLSGSDVFVTTGSADTNTVFDVLLTEQPKRLFFNEVKTAFNYENNCLSVNSDKTNSSENGSQSVPSAGIITDKNNSGGGSTSGGSSGGGVSGGTSLGGTTAAFKDIENHWAKDYILSLKEKNIVSGDENGNYNPDLPIKRSEFVAISVRTLGLSLLNYQNAFEDVSKDVWYAPYVQTALDFGLISQDTLFRPDDLITRQEIAKVVSQMAKLGEKCEPLNNLSEIYTDADKISEWATVYVDYITQSGLMNGRDDKSFCPQDTATRAETAAVIFRMLQMK